MAQFSKFTITPYLWFDTEAEDAMKFYTSIFEDSKIISTTPGPEGKVMTVEFELCGQRFIGLNAGPQFKFNESVSFLISCKTQEEIDYLWGKLTEGGEEQPCAWLKDKFGLSWQVVPEALGELIGNPNPQRAGNAIQAMLKMKKIIIKDLEDAANAA